MGRKMGLVRMSVAGAAMLVLGACAATYQNHGYVPAADELARIKVGDPQTQVVKLIGTPSTEGMVKPRSWYYVQSRFRIFGPYKPKEVEREVVAISFDTQDRVANIQRFGLQQGHVVTLSSRVTESSVKQLGLIQQLLTDLGRFSASSIGSNRPTN